MTWCDDIDHALERAGSRYTALDVIGLLRAGKGAMWATDKMHASAWINNELGKPEVMHMAGVWNDADARWIVERMKAWARGLGHESIHISGRRGWMRFLQQRGVI